MVIGEKKKKAAIIAAYCANSTESSDYCSNNTNTFFQTDVVFSRGVIKGYGKKHNLNMFDSHSKTSKLDNSF